MNNAINQRSVPTPTIIDLDSEPTIDFRSNRSLVQNLDSFINAQPSTSSGIYREPVEQVIAVRARLYRKCKLSIDEKSDNTVAKKVNVRLRFLYDLDINVIGFSFFSFFFFLLYLSFSFQKPKNTPTKNVDLRSCQQSAIAPTEVFNRMDSDADINPNALLTAPDQTVHSNQSNLLVPTDRNDESQATVPIHDDNNNEPGQTVAPVIETVNTVPQVSESIQSIATPRTSNSTGTDTSNLPSEILSYDFDPDQFETVFAHFDFNLPSSDENQK